MSPNLSLVSVLSRPEEAAETERWMIGVVQTISDLTAEAVSAPDVGPTRDVFPAPRQPGIIQQNWF